MNKEELELIEFFEKYKFKSNEMMLTKYTKIIDLKECVSLLLERIHTKNATNVHIDLLKQIKSRIYDTWKSF